MEVSLNMKELRVDSITEDIVIFALDRSNRPLDKAKVDIDEEIVNEYEKGCPFCRKNEGLATEETSRIEIDKKWVTRSIYNKYPIIDTSSKGVYGIHEVIIDTYRHNGTFYNMSTLEYENLIKMYKDRYSSLKNNDNIRYITIFKNFLRKAGASLDHPHSQIMSLSVLPPEINNEIRVAKEFYDNNGFSLYDSIIKDEIQENQRVVYNGDAFLAIVPYASKYSGEVRIIFKNKKRFEAISNKEIKELSLILNKLFLNIYREKGYMPFNLCVHTHPINEDCINYFNVHIHIIPRKFNFGGFELGSDIYVSSSKPEDLAKKIKFD